jgi:hypothetical protein
VTPKLDQIIARQKAKLAKLEERIGTLMSQRALEEEVLAVMLAEKNPPAAPPNVADSGQPFQGSQRIVLEKRTPEGKLDFSDPQPPIRVHGGTHKGFDQTRDLNFDDVYQMFFKECPEAPGSWTALREWLDSKGWVVRPKTW